MNTVTVHEEGSPIILAFPHVGTFVPEDIFQKLNKNGQRLADTDWHVDRLYDGLLGDATKVIANFHRYVVDANRDPADVSLYPGQNTTGLCPLTDFDGNGIWREGHAPTEIDVRARQQAFHSPYHSQLTAQLKRIKDKYGFAVLYDCHSIRSNIPYLFEGGLPDFNIGTNNGATCDPLLEGHMVDVCARANGYSYVLNGRFKGGWTTRNYASVTENIHVIQMELAQSTYAQEIEPWEYDKEKASQLRPILSNILEGLARIALETLGK